MRINPFIALILLLTLSIALPACSGLPSRVDYAREYPINIHQKHVLDIQVFLEPRHISFTNTTARAFGPSTIWLNEWYGYPIDELAVGEHVRIPLTKFRDRNHEFFRPGGFWATREADRLVLAQLETHLPSNDSEESLAVLYGMVVIAKTE